MLAPSEAQAAAGEPMARRGWWNGKFVQHLSTESLFPPKINMHSLGGEKKYRISFWCPRSCSLSIHAIHAVRTLSPRPAGRTIAGVAFPAPSYIRYSVSSKPRLPLLVVPPSCPRSAPTTSLPNSSRDCSPGLRSTLLAIFFLAYWLGTKCHWRLSGSGSGSIPPPSPFSTLPSPHKLSP